MCMWQLLVATLWQLAGAELAVGPLVGLLAKQPKLGLGLPSELPMAHAANGPGHVAGRP